MSYGLSDAQMQEITQFIAAYPYVELIYKRQSS
jgi:hypothetical protein